MKKKNLRNRREQELQEQKLEEIMREFSAESEQTGEKPGKETQAAEEDYYSQNLDGIMREFSRRKPEQPAEETKEEAPKESLPAEDAEKDIPAENGPETDEVQEVPENREPEADGTEASSETIPQELDGPDLILDEVTEVKEEPEILREELPTEIPHHAPDRKQEDMEQTVRLDIPPRPRQKVESDTIRLDGIAQKLPKGKVKNASPLEDTQVLDVPPKEEPFSEHWEPEYDQPMGEYVPPQPIVFQPRSRLKELKKKLVNGPEKRYYELSEKGFGKIQSAIFFSLIIALAAVTATVIYAVGMVTDDRMRLMVFGQFFTMLLSGLLGVNLMMDGVSDLFGGKFTLNTMLVVTFTACCIDGIFCLRQLRVPCCAAFCLQVTMALLSSYEKRKIEISQMDTMRKANRLDGVAVCPDYYEGRKAFLRKEGQVEEFMDHYDQPSTQEKAMNIYALTALAVSAAIAVFAGVRNDVYVAVRVWAISLLAAVPATAFIAFSRPYAVLENKLHSLGTVLCGWGGIGELSGKAVFPLVHSDIYPSGSARLNGVKFYGSRKPDDVVAYTAAIVSAENGGLTEVFRQILDSRSGYHYDARSLEIYEGGIGGEVEGEQVLVGTQNFLKRMNVEIPGGIRVNCAVCTAINGEFCGLFALTFDKVRSSYAGMAALNNSHGLMPVLVSSDFVLTPHFLQNRFGIKPKNIVLPDQEVKAELLTKTLAPEAPSLLMTTRTGLANVTMGIAGARYLRTAAILGLAVHLIGGILGLGIMLALVFLGAFQLLTPVNMFLYQLVWIVPGLLFTEWTRTA